MAGLQVGARVSVRLPKGTRYGQVLQERGGFYQCRFDDGATGWVDARDVTPETEPLRSSMPPAEVFSQPPPGARSIAPVGMRQSVPPGSASSTPQPPIPGYVPPVYAPSNASLVVAGDLQTQDARRLIEKWFGDVKPGARPEPMTIPGVALTGA